MKNSFYRLTLILLRQAHTRNNMKVLFVKPKKRNCSFGPVTTNQNKSSTLWMLFITY